MFSIMTRTTDCSASCWCAGHNKISSLQGLAACLNLRDLDLSHNRLCGDIEERLLPVCQWSRQLRAKMCRVGLRTGISLVNLEFSSAIVNQY